MTVTASVEKADDRVEGKKRSKSSQLFGEIANVMSRTAGRAPTFAAAVDRFSGSHHRFRA